MGFQLSSKQNNVKFYHKVNLFSYFKIIWTALVFPDNFNGYIYFTCYWF
jgi:hypothetical protein